MYIYMCVCVYVYMYICVCVYLYMLYIYYIGGLTQPAVIKGTFAAGELQRQ